MQVKVCMCDDDNWNVGGGIVGGSIIVCTYFYYYYFYHYYYNTYYNDDDEDERFVKCFRDSFFHACIPSVVLTYTKECAWSTGNSSTENLCEASERGRKEEEVSSWLCSCLHFYDDYDDSENDDDVENSLAVALNGDST